jgi:S-DNA-T family DNA segregation ATPase FtsK/SpoIIIE
MAPTSAPLEPEPEVVYEEVTAPTTPDGSQLDDTMASAPLRADAVLSNPLDGELTRAAVEYQLPARELLHDAKKVEDLNLGIDLEKSALVLEDTLKDFGIACKVTNVEKGPVVTRYEILPAAGVRVERIASLSNNIALALKAMSVRVQAPIPGKGVVGIEVPNGTKTAVFLSHVVDEPAWDTGQHALPLALGQDVGGRTMIADLGSMPHLLIAGATGAGKSVCINSILAGLLMARSPDQMRLMLVDPKIVEFAGYEDHRSALGD